MNHSQPNPFPTLKSSLPAAFSTLFRSKNIGDSDFSMKRSFYLEAIDQTQLKDYINFFGFSTQEAIPLSYLYLIAQPAQIALMLDKSFPLPLPGMVHINNSLILLSKINLHVTLSLEVSALIEAKTEGSLFPKMAVDFFQEGQKVAVCKSGYFVRRKSSAKKKTRPEESFSFPNVHQESWTIPGMAGWDYARLSGDVNPIHLSGIFAKLMGFKGRIIHGWYSLSRSVALMGKQFNAPFREISVDFKKPLLIRGKAVLDYGAVETGGVDFTLHDEAREVVFLTGRVLI